MGTISGSRFTGFAVLVLALGLLTAPAHAEDPPAPAPTVTEIRVFGKSVKGRALRAYRIGDPSSTRKVVLMSTMHGNEAGTAKILMNLIKGSPVSGADIWVIPYLNRDGLARSKRQNARGVDLNRNFPLGWKKRTGTYNSGRAPASEPETKALMKFVLEVKPSFIVSLHQPLYGIDTSYAKGRPLALRLSKELRLPKKVFNCTSGCTGTMTQWYNKRRPGAAITVEYGARVTNYQANRTGPTGLLAAVFAER